MPTFDFMASLILLRKIYHQKGFVSISKLGILVGLDPSCLLVINQGLRFN